MIGLEGKSMHCMVYIRVGAASVMVTHARIGLWSE